LFLSRIILFTTLLCASSYAQVPNNEDFHDLTSTRGLSVDWRVYSSSGGASRCKTSDCLCSVKPGKAIARKSSIKKAIDRRISAYFSEGSYNITNDIRDDINSFMNLFPDSSFTVIGYTDGCGESSHNELLAERRVKAVRELFSERTRSKMNVAIFMSEVTGLHDPSSRRVDVVAHTKSRITTIVDKIPADVYLIDASGSMWSSWREWTDIIAASFKPGSRVYLSKTTGCSNGELLSSINPGGGTEIWYSYWRVLDHMDPGETLLIVSDFRSDIPLTRRESVTIENKVTERGVKVIAVTL